MFLMEEVCVLIVHQECAYRTKYREKAEPLPLLWLHHCLKEE
jgi:hypothetical protein